MASAYLLMQVVSHYSRNKGHLNVQYEDCGGRLEYNIHNYVFNSVWSSEMKNHVFVTLESAFYI